ncbi:MAG: tetratricopeptide repeat protein [Planctomycetes bacterium]|nr:tetratricopeptide repeat protein [Planctomycetota bacterium]
MSTGRRKQGKRPGPPRASRTEQRSGPEAAVRVPGASRRLWLCRLAALLLAPALFLLLLEAGLRLGGYGFPAAATIPCQVNGVPCRGDNVKFGWRFFPRALAQEFDPFVFAAAKPAHTRRLFVLGESAAQGTPDCAYSFGRILEVLLDHAHPGTDFEVITVAMPAINSHAVVEIAKDLAGYQPDFFVVYVGNNEVVGPYGPGTIFAPLSPSLSLIRAGICFKSTRTGQLLADVAARLGARAPSPEVWRGLEMFAAGRVAADDPRLETVYRHFRRNLADIRDIAAGSGAGVLFCTLGANLRDCPPFASLHRADLGKDDLAKWTALYEAGTQRETAGDYAGAIESYLAAARIDGRFADLQFRLGHCYRQADDPEQARERFGFARELDALRFRPDDRLNAIIREVASTTGDARVQLVDVEEVFRAESPAGMPGRELFHEHVHLTFRGNYLLAKMVAMQVCRALGTADERSLLEEEGCARRVAYNAWAHYNVLFKVLNYYLRKPPFTGQLYHAEQVRRLEGDLLRANATPTAEKNKQIAAHYRDLIGASPGDIWLRLRFAEFASVFLRDEPTAVEECRRVQALAPHSYKPHLSLALSLGNLHRFEEAIEYLNQAVRIKPTCGQGYHMLGLAHQARGRPDDALTCYARSVRLSPDNAEAYRRMHDILLSQGKANEARAILRQAAAGGPGDRPFRAKVGHLWEPLTKGNHQ